MNKLITFITYESPWFAAGGIAAVMGQLPFATAMAAHLPTIVITPFHIKPKKIAALETQVIGNVLLTYAQSEIQITVLYINAQCPWYFLRVEECQEIQPPFFAGVRHPYDVKKEILLRDSLFFGVMTVESLRCIAEHQIGDTKQVEWNLIAQDWEAATSLLALASQQTHSGRLHL